MLRLRHVLIEMQDIAQRTEDGRPIDVADVGLLGERATLSRL
jgi:hypothetical protein